MSSLFSYTEDFRAYQTKLGRDGRPSAATNTLTTKVRVFVPVTDEPELRWRLTTFLLDVIRSPIAPDDLRMGASMSILAMYAERPGALIRGILNDPDIEVIIIDVSDFEGEVPVLERRGNRATEEMAALTRVVAAARETMRGRTPFIDPRAYTMAIHDVSTLISAIVTVETQIWILVAKAVTAPDTAEESENRRWNKYLQQRRVNALFELNQGWLTIMRNLIAGSLSLRKFMVELLIEAKKGSAVKGRAVEIIADIGNYVEETGMAGFFATIRYGIETRYPALALNEFQGDLNIIKNLMEVYKTLGPRAPYIVLLEDSIQTKFAPGSYPLLWSFAMGVGTTLDKAMTALNINRGYLEPVYFRLGQRMARNRVGTVDTRMAAELGLTSDQLSDLSTAIVESNVGKQELTSATREGRFASSAPNIIEVDEESEDEQPQPRQGQQAQFRAQPTGIQGRETQTTSGVGKSIQELRSRLQGNRGLNTSKVQQRNQIDDQTPVQSSKDDNRKSMDLEFIDG
ncbi:nucleoprotein [Ghana virus]|uniref:Nucleocapsid n=1 Tax=Ghana virus TaxID=2847089 RepID=I0E088_9MONO|nr:nucleoprotein [Ghana virus]AFH96006.1 nucleoprotein [Ghana virus]